MQKRRINYNVIIAIISYFCLVILYIPCVAVMVTSFNDTRFGLSWRGFTFRWYSQLFENEYILEAALNSLIVATTSTIVATILGTALALGLYRANFPNFFGRIIRLSINLPIVVPDIIMAVALSVAFGFFRAFAPIFEMGMFTLVLSHVTFQISFVTLTVRSRLATLDKDLDVAAKDLNAYFFYSFRRITLPLLTPSIIAGAMLAFTLSLDDFIISFFIHGPESVTLPIYIFASLKRGITPEIHALSTVILAATIVLIIVAERLATVLIKRSKKEVKDALDDIGEKVGDLGLPG